MKYLSRENQADITEAFNSTLRYLDNLLNIDNIYFDQMVDHIYPTELQLNRANSSNTEAPFLDLNHCISNDTVSTKIYDKRDDFGFAIVNFPFLDGDFPQRSSYGVYIKGKRKVQGVPQPQTAALPRPQEEEENDKSKQAQTEQTHEKH